MVIITTTIMRTVGAIITTTFTPMGMVPSTIMGTATITITARPAIYSIVARIPQASRLPG